MTGNRLMLIAAGILLIGTSGYGAAIDTFDSGTFPATGSGQWSGGWTYSLNPTNQIQVTDASPLDDGGDYLSIYTLRSYDSPGSPYVARQFDATEWGSEQYQVQATFRLDAHNIPVSTFLFNVQQGSTATGFFGDVGTVWSVGATKDGTFSMLNYTAGAADNIGTAITLTLGHVYRVTALVTTGSANARVTLEDLTSSLSETHNTVSNAPATASPYIMSGSMVTNSGNLTWSLDSLRIIPEPATLALLSLGGLVVLRRRSRC